MFERKITDVTNGLVEFSNQTINAKNESFIHFSQIDIVINYTYYG